MQGTAVSPRPLRPLIRYAAQVLHHIEHKYHGHRVGVIAARLLGGRRTVASIAATVTVHDVRVLFQASAALVQFDDFAGVDPRVVAQYLQYTIHAVLTNAFILLKYLCGFFCALYAH